MPWILNTSLTIFIYSLQGLSEDDRYWVLIIFGLLMINVSGLGGDLNFLAFLKTSINRIHNFLETRGSTGEEVPPENIKIST